MWLLPPFTRYLLCCESYYLRIQMAQMSIHFILNALIFIYVYVYLLSPACSEWFCDISNMCYI